MAEITFVIDQTALDTVKNTKLTANFDEMEAALTESIAPYEKLIVSEDAITEAKNDRAKINKTKGSIDSYRKLVKGIYTEPLKQFEEKCKTLCAICDRGLQNIDTQLADFEKRRIQDKFYNLKYYYENAAKENPEYITIEMALHPKWQNKTTSFEECTKYIDDAISKVDTEIRTIRNLHSKWETSLLNEYAKSHDLLAALALNEQLTQTALQEAERKRKMQEEQARREAELERQRQEAEQVVAETVKEVRVAADNFEAELQKAIDADLVKTASAITEPEYVGILKICGTMQELQAVREFLDSHGFHYTLVSEKYALS